MLRISLDKKDKILLYELSLNGRISITELGATCQGGSWWG